MSEPITLEVGMQVPTFSAVDSNGITHTSDEYIKNGRSVIVYFYPRDSTPGCTKQACDFRDNMARLKSEGYEVLGVSKDSEKSHQKFITKQELNFSLLLDEERTLHDQFGTWRMKKNYGREYMGCVRSTFVINPQGLITWCRYNVRAKGHVEMLLRELSFQE